MYKLYNVEDLIENVHLVAEGHDYGPSKRAAAFRFMAKHLRLQLSEIVDTSGQVDERFVTIQASDEMKVFTKQKPRPAHAIVAIEELR